MRSTSKKSRSCSRSTRRAEYREVSPFSQVPALVLDDGTKITESRAICTYFEGIFPEPNLMAHRPEGERR
jgi:glutathione S-transferase